MRPDLNRKEKRPEILKAIRRRPLKFLRKIEGLRSDFALYGMPVKGVSLEDMEAQLGRH